MAFVSLPALLPCETEVSFVAFACVGFRFLKEFLRQVGENVHQLGIAYLSREEIPVRPFGLPGIEYERVLALFAEIGIVAVKVPVAGITALRSSAMLVPMPDLMPWDMHGA